MNIVKPLARLFGTGAAKPAAPAPTPPAPPTVAERVAALETGAPDRLIAAAMGGEEPLRAAALRKLAQLLDAGTLDLAALRAADGTGAALLSVASQSSNPELLPQVLRSLDDPRRLVELAAEGSSSRIRQLAAHSVEDPAQLRQLLKRVRGKDKNVYKIVKEKCDVLRAEEQRIAQIASDVEAACASLERHGSRIYDAIYVAALEQYEARWLTLEGQAAVAVRERARQALARCRAVIAGHEQQLTDRATHEAQRVARASAREQALVHADAESQRQHEESTLAAAEAAKRREADEQARAERLAVEAQAIRQLGGLIGKTNAALREGNTGRAAGLRRAIEEKLPTMPTVPPYLASQVQQLDEKLTNLKQWKDYAVAPKRAELIEEMESLIGSSEEPPALAERIKRLQEEWKTISKGIVSDSEADWQRFHQASVTAYQPCREYYEAQAKRRLDNLDKRKRVLERLLAFETAQNVERPDWRAVAAVLREARQEIRRHAPVDRAAGAAVQEEFDAALGRLQSRLEAWHAGNAAEKRVLIARAQQLLGLDDGRDAVDGVKRLQLLWKDTGAAQRELEQQLWEEFREHCDAIFQKRQQAHAEYTAALGTNKAHAVTLCVAAETLAALSGPALVEGAAKIPEWRAAFDGLGEMPRADQRELHERFERAVNRCRTELALERARERERGYVNLLEAARRIQAYGWAVAQNAAAADSAALKDIAMTFVAGIQQWPKGGAQALKEAWLKAEAAGGLDFAAQAAALRTLCLRSEICADMATPAEDQALRREYQVQRLVRRMGQQDDAAADDLDGLALEWVRVGPAAAATYEALLARFESCRGSSPPHGERG